MTSLLPIVHRELTLASRRRGTYWTRCCTAMLVGGVLFAMALSIEQPSAQVAQMIFWVLKVMTFAYCLFAGVRYTADTLSEERREGTLGLLFLTDLRGYDVVIGKLVVTSLNAFFGLLAVIPLLAVPVMMGGLTMGEFWRLTFVLINTLFFSLAVGLVVSAFGAQERNVMLATLVCILVATFGLPLLWESITNFSNARWLDYFFQFSSPFYALKISASGLFVAVPSDFWPCMMTIAGMSLACVITASLRLPHSFQEPSHAPKANGRRNRNHRLTFGSDFVRARVRRYLRNGRPYLWRVSRDRMMGQWSLLFAVCAAVFGVFSIVVAIDSSLPGRVTRGMEPILMFGWLAAHWLIKLLVASEACRPFSEDKRSGALELLLCTPLRPTEMIAAQRHRLRRVFLLPLAVVCGANFLIAVSINDRVLSTLFCLGIFTLPADCWALRWAGLHFSVACHSFTRAVFSTLWRVMMPSWIAFFVMMLAMMATQPSESAMRSTLALWAVGSVTYDLWLVSWKRITLAGAFRRLAADDTRVLLSRRPPPIQVGSNRAAAAFP